MNIAFLTRDYPTGGGTARFNHTLSCALAQRGHAVHVIAQALDGLGTQTDEGVLVHRVRSNTRKFSAWARINHNYKAWLKLRELVHGHRIDIVQADYWSAEGFLPAIMKQTPLVIWSQSSPLDAIKTRSYRGIGNLGNLVILQTLADFTARRADKVIADSAANYQQIVGRLQLDSHKCALVYPGVDITKFKFVQSQIKTVLGVPSEEPTVLFVGLLEPRKGIDVFLRAMPKIVRAVPSVRFIIVGKDTNLGPGGRSMHQHIMAQASKHRIVDRVIRLEAVPDETLVQLYSACDVLAFPSVHESFGFPIIEAMACGKPFVATKTGIAAELKPDRRTGSVVAIGDSEAMADEIVMRLLLTPEEKAATARRNCATVQSDFSAQVWAERMEAVYSQTLSQTVTKNLKAS